MKITQSEVGRLALPASGDVMFWDDELPGFGVRVWASGRKSYVVMYRHGGRQRKVTLGHDPVVTVTQARAAARELLAELQLTRHDPMERIRTEQKRGVTLGDVLESYKAEHVPRKASGREDLWKIKKYFGKGWTERPILEITRADLGNYHRKISRTHPVAANRVMALFSKIWNFAEESGLIPEGSPNPVRKLKKNRERSRDRFVTVEEMPRLWAAIASEGNVYVRAAMLLYLLSGARKMEILRLRWDDVDTVRREMTFKRTKAGRKHTVPLTDFALSLFSALPLEVGLEEWVFPGVGGHRKDIRRQWERVKEDAELGDVTIHDLRRTLGSWLSQSGHSLALIGALLNHADPKTTLIYSRFQNENMREALEDHERRLLAAAAKSPSEKRSTRRPSSQAKTSRSK